MSIGGPHEVLPPHGAERAREPRMGQHRALRREAPIPHRWQRQRGDPLGKEPREGATGTDAPTKDPDSLLVRSRMCRSVERRNPATFEATDRLSSPLIEQIERAELAIDLRDGLNPHESITELVSKLGECS